MVFPHILMNSLVKKKKISFFVIWVHFFLIFMFVVRHINFVYENKFSTK